MSAALQFGEFPERSEEPDWPSDLDDAWKSQLDDHQGRMQAWQHWHAKGTDPEKRVALLKRWLTFLQTNPRFFSDLLLSNANLVCATTIGCATQRGLRDASYDYVIVDEAGKEEARRLLVPLIRGERWILVGDHQQLPPYADDELKAKLKHEGLDPTLITRSLFEELQAPFQCRGSYVFLDQQGRMHPDISAFVSQSFYDGKLQNFPHAATRDAPTPSFIPDKPHLCVLDTAGLADRFETCPRSGQVFNKVERDIILLVLRDVLQRNDSIDASHTETMSQMTVGVIAPYRRQVEEIGREVRRDAQLRKRISDGSLQIGTVDSFQGQEKDLVIFSCTRSNPKGRVGFVDNRQRLNVALSRARGRLLVILDSSTIEKSLHKVEVAESEADNRYHLHSLLVFVKERGGYLEVPSNWRKLWKTQS